MWRIRPRVEVLESCDVGTPSDSWTTHRAVRTLYEGTRAASRTRLGSRRWKGLEGSLTMP